MHVAVVVYVRFWMYVWRIDGVFVELYIEQSWPDCMHIGFSLLIYAFIFVK